jgi:hypothetical protein
MKTIVPAAGLILNIAYGYNVRNCEDPFVTIADEATRNTVKAGGPGAMLCDMFPMCELAFQVRRGCHGDPEAWTHLTSSPDSSEVHASVVPICPFQTTCLVHEGTGIKDV